MKLKNYITDNLYIIVTIQIIFIITILLLIVFKSPLELIISIIIIYITTFITLFVIGYLRKKKFYNDLLINLERLDKKYLILETLEKPNFYEGEILCNILYDIDKSMLENVKEYQLATQDFKEYIEMWIHEIKLPLSSLTLMAHNHNIDKNFLVQLKRLDSYLEQVLYYTRIESAEKDYLIKENSLPKIINSIALKNKDDLLENNIDFQIEDINYTVTTDAKWLEFIVNQIISNSIKYSDNKKKNKYIKITATKDIEKTKLIIEDNGIGINKRDISRVFEKTFTGENGRIKKTSTGMGLYIVKKLCDKLGHKIEIESIQNKYTKLTITFVKSELYDVVK